MFQRLILSSALLITMIDTAISSDLQENENLNHAISGTPIRGLNDTDTKSIKENRTGLFPENFTNQELYELIEKGKVETDFKVYSIDEESKKVLNSYSPGTWQIITGNGFRDRVKLGNENTSNLTARYMIYGTYISTEAEITLKGSYNIFRKFFKNEELSDVTQTIFRLYDYNETFIKQTPDFRLNKNNQDLFLVLKLLEKPAYEELDREDLDAIALKDYWKYLGTEMKIDNEIIKQIKLEEKIRLDDDTNIRIANDLKAKIYKKIGVDPALLERQIELMGGHKIASLYQNLEQMKKSGASQESIDSWMMIIEEIREKSL